MPAINWAFLYDNAFPDAAGKPCLSGMFESLALGGLLATVPQMSVGMQVAMAGGESGEFTLLVKAPSGRELNRQAALYTAPPRGGATIIAKMEELSQLVGRDCRGGLIYSHYPRAVSRLAPW